MLGLAMRPPRKLATDEQLYTAAIRALMRRAHSIYEMRQALERRAQEKAAAAHVLQRLKNEKLLDDARYARQFAHHRAESRRQGRFRIARDLRARGIPDRHIETALEEVFQETDERALLRKRIERRLKLQRGPLDQRKLASLYGSLLRAGFSADLIRAELHALTHRDVPDLADAAPPEEE
jgi:regulatory protein